MAFSNLKEKRFEIVIIVFQKIRKICLFSFKMLDKFCFSGSLNKTLDFKHLCTREAIKPIILKCIILPVFCV